MLACRMLWLGAGLLVAGCVAPAQNPQEFRKLAVDGYFDKQEIVSARSFAEMTATFKKMAPKCLDVSIKVTYSCGRSWCTNQGTWLRHYKPTFVSGPRMLSLDLSREWVLKEPRPEYKPEYMMVVDIYPLPNGKSKVVLYAPYETLASAAKSWISGEDMGCPDLTELR